MSYIEELSKVVTLINGLGDAASDDFVWWIALQVFKEVWTPIGAVIMLLTTGYLLRPVILALRVNLRAAEVLKELRNLLEIGSPGFLSEREAYQILKKVRSMKQAEDKGEIK